jgi:LCP family protein required for cell wall assembly
VGEPPRRPAAPRKDPGSTGTRRPPAARTGDRPPPRPQSRPRQEPPPPPRKRSRLGPRIALTVASLLVMSLTGYAWAAMQGLVNGLNHTDVIDSNAGGAKPADGAVDILLVGMDSRTDADGNPLSPEVLAQLQAGVSDGEQNTDTLIFVHIPNDGSKAVAVSLPRDSYVDVPGYSGKHKINSAYAMGSATERTNLTKKNVKDQVQIAQQTAQAGAKVLIATVAKLTGSTIDHYAAINLLGFNDITNAIGGVDVCLNNDVNDSYSGAKFTKGNHTISGVQALQFVRQRHGLLRGDLDRVVRQQVFMAGMAKKMLSAGTLADPAKLSDLTAAIKKSVVIDQGWDIFAFAQQMKGLSGGQLEFRTIPVVNPDYRTPDGESAIQVDPKAINAFIQGITGPPPAAAAPPAENKAITVDVRNASGKTGLAASVSQDLSGKGFTAGDTANATSRKTSVVRVPTGQEAAGQSVATALGSKATVEVDKTVTAGHVLVMLGSDYSGQAAPASSTQSSAPAAPSTPAAPPITANGVTCVN